MTVKLTTEQIRAVESRQPKLCILACAGSGKTTTLTRRVAYHIENVHLEPSSAAIITFTKAAANNLQVELAHLLKESSATSTLFIGTIHSFCFTLLGEDNPLEAEEYSVLTDTQQFMLLNRYWNQWAIQKVSPKTNKSRLLEQIVSSIDIIKTEGLESNVLQDNHPELARVYSLYENYLEQNQRYDFAGLISNTVNKLDTDDQYRNKIIDQYKHIFVDEYQDVDPLQERLIRILSERAELSVVGDDDQAIYQFRGTDVKNIRTMASKLPSDAVISLADNRRCASNLTELSKSIIEKSADRLSKTIQSVYQGGNVHILEFDTVAKEAAFIASMIVSQNSAGRPFGEIAILIRSVSSHGAHYIKALRAKNVPFVCRGDRGLFKRPEVAWIVSALELICKEVIHVEHLGELSELLNLDLDHLESDKSDVDDLEDQNLISLGFQSEDIDIIHRILLIRDKYRKREFRDLLEIVILVIEQLDLISSKTLESWGYNVCAFTQIVNEFEKIDETMNLQRFCGYIKLLAHRKFDEAGPLDPGQNAVQILTVHQAKGLEYDCVFVPMLVERRFPLQIKNRRERWLLDDDLFDVKRYQTSLDDERRLFYVAITRARDDLFLSRAHDVGLKNPVRASLFHSEASAFVVPSPRKIPKRPKRSSKNLLPLVTSHTDLEYYHTCPYRYQLLREYKLATPNNPFAFSIGRALHFALSAAHHSSRIGELLTPDEIVARFESRVENTKGVPRYVLKTRIQKLTKHIRAYCDDKQSWVDQTFEVERPFRMPAFNAVVRGRIDLITGNDREGYTIIDWKTGKYRSYLQPTFQMQLYASAARRHLGLDVRRTILYYLEEKKTVESEVSDEFLANGERVLKDTIEGISQKRFAATPGRVCTRCECKQVCEYRDEGAN